MANRRIPYGYMLKNGELTVNFEEEATVKRIFTAYLAGESYQGIAEMLNREEVPFSTEAPEWNKHKVKRLLENSRYIGEQGYPPIIQIEIFIEVKLLIESKTANYRPRAAAENKAAIAENPVDNNVQSGLIYTLSLEARQLDNVINRELEKPNNSAAILELILKGIQVRYTGIG